MNEANSTLLKDTNNFMLQNKKYTITNDSRVAHVCSI